MPRPTIDIEPYKGQISKWILEDGHKLNHVVELLEKEHKIVMKKRTLERNLAEWKITTQPRLRNKEAVREKLYNLFYECQLTDEEICELMTESGYPIKQYSLRRLRKQMGLNKRIIRGTEEELEQTIKQLLEKEYQDPSAKKLSRSDLYAFLRAKYPEHHIVGRDRVYRIAREMNPERLNKRRRKNADTANAISAVSGGEASAPEGYAPAQAYIPPGDYSSPQDYVPAANNVPPPQEPVVDPVFADQVGSSTMTAASQALQTTSRLGFLERENGVLHERLHQQEAEIDYLRQAYRDLLTRFGAVPAAGNGFRA